MKRLRHAGALFLIAATCLLILFGLGELGLRTAVFSSALRIESLRQAWRYADPAFDDDFWKLTRIFGTEGQAVFDFARPDTVLGWTIPTTADNPLGVTSLASVRPDSVRSPVLFFGDSYVAGLELGESLVDELNEILIDRTALNYGVSGYGVGQMYLRFLQVLEEFDGSGVPDRPVVLVGILTSDLDRTVLSFRGHQKPKFEMANGRLELTNVPLSLDTREHLGQYPVRIRSYLYRAISMRLRSLLGEEATDVLFGYKERREQRSTVNRALFDAFKTAAEVRGIPIGFVIFTGMDELQPSGWRETYLRRTLAELALPHFDAEAHLMTRMEQDGLDAGDVYYVENNHLNLRGNAIVADGLTGFLESFAPLAPR